MDKETTMHGKKFLLRPRLPIGPVGDNPFLIYSEIKEILEPFKREIKNELRKELKKDFVLKKKKSFFQRLKFWK